MFRPKVRLRFLFPILLVLVLLVTGCLGSSQPKFVTITGTVTEEDTGVTLSGVTVEIGTLKTTTNNLGQYSLKNVPSGSGTLKATLDGYEPTSMSVNLTKDQVVNLTLKTNAPQLNMAALELWSGDDELQDGDEIEGTTIYLEGNLNELFGVSVTSMRTQPAAMGSAQVIINGEVYPLVVDDDGFFSQTLPVNPGANIIQLRVRSSEGYGRTSGIITIHVNIPRLDVRAILAWDTPETDVDLHLFKRSGNETNTFVLNTSDRHVYWSNDEPDDFGTGAENPFLDIDDVDGYGPETIVVKEATVGDYHIWVHPWALYNYPLTNATVTIYLDWGTSSAVQRVFSLELPAELEDEGQYVTTIRVAANGAKSFVDVTPVEALPEFLTLSSLKTK